MITNVIKGESVVVTASESRSGLWARLKRAAFRWAFGSPSVRISVSHADCGCVEFAIDSDGMEVSVEDAETVSVPATEENLEREFGNGIQQEGGATDDRPESWRVDRRHPRRNGGPVRDHGRGEE